MRTLRQGLTGKDVTAWQFFLRGQDLYHAKVDGDFGPLTHEATRLFQAGLGLEVDGIVGNETYAAAMLRGFSLVPNDTDEKSGPNWPPPPDFPPLVGTAARQKVFGTFSFKPSGSTSNPEAIVITDDWAKQNIVSVDIPQLKGLRGPRGPYLFHKLAADKVQKLFQRWEDEGLKELLLTWGGSWVPRFVRGSRTTLSNHAFGTAFDINVEWNYLGTQPALVGKKGSVRELVPIANELGFYWGGHFKRQDGMHLELARL